MYLDGRRKMLTESDVMALQRRELSSWTDDDRDNLAYTAVELFQDNQYLLDRIRAADAIDELDDIPGARRP